MIKSIRGCWLTHIVLKDAKITHFNRSSIGGCLRHSCLLNTCTTEGVELIATIYNVTLFDAIMIL